MAVKATSEKRGKYSPELAKQLPGMMGDGMLLGEIAAAWGVNRVTIYKWEREHPEFAEAMAEGRNRVVGYLEELGIRGARGEVDGFNAAAWIFLMKNRAGWRDKQDHTTNNESVNFMLSFGGGDGDDG